MFQRGGGISLLPPPAKRRRSEVDGGVQRSRECPTAVRAFRFASDDIATQSELCSAVLQVPSVGIAKVALSVTATAADAAHPTAVLTLWSDTTTAEAAKTLLDAVRSDVDRVFAERQSGSEVRGSLNENELQPQTIVTRSDVASTATYVVKLLAGSVGSGGTATLCVLANVGFRQVVSGESFVFPVRRADGIDTETPLLALPYHLGDPLFFTCTRVH
ncbi:hypothetical protein DQ04_09341010 [Trypanosoma grayi]|uniref:hypothetical protein n=1 Tax=Trypanosoma grayi TaxID=71804 RepID=UPI0004F44596|nr:hypothetical protein DQ04_09341010 [Trypanosoma grayi]KEG07588.1 hypothetical protein DQ04_09341010 [Trypanosoma grayi]